MGKRKYAGLLIVFGLAVVAGSPLRAQEARYEVNVSKYLMGTRVDATVMHGDVNAARQALVRAFMEMERIEQVMSAHLDDSEIVRVNDAAGHAPVPVSAETFALLQRAKDYARRFEGLFDVSIGPLTETWGFSGDAPVALPDSSTLAALRTLVDYRDIVLNDRDTTIFLAREGMRLDLGGVAKGYAIDRAVAVLRAEGITHFLLNAGGDIYASGRKSKGHPWTLGVKHPRDGAALIATLTLADGAVATSGDYERFVDIDGRRYHHIIDPRTGFPATRSRSVTVLADTAEEADALATYLFIKGVDADVTIRDEEPPFIGVDAAGGVHFAPSLVEQHTLTLLP